MTTPVSCGGGSGQTVRMAATVMAPAAPAAQPAAGGVVTDPVARQQLWNQLQGILTAIAQASQGAQTIGAPLPAAPATAGANLVISGASPAEQQSFRTAVAKLASLPSGAGIAQRLQQTGARFVVEEDATFSSPQIQGYYDPNDGTIHIRRSLLSKADPTELIHTIAHEGVHLIDEASSDAFLARGRAAGLSNQLLMHQDSLITETNAYYLGGRVMRELGVTADRLQQGTPAWAAMANGTPDAVRRGIWATLQQSSLYNPNGISAQYQTY